MNIKACPLRYTRLQLARPAIAAEPAIEPAIKLAAGPAAKPALRFNDPR